MAVKTLATLQAEIDVAIAALGTVEDTMDTALEGYTDEPQYLSDTVQFCRSMKADLAKYALQLTGYKAQAAVRNWPTS